MYLLNGRARVFATGGKELNLRKETMEELTAPAVSPEQYLYDEILRMDSYYSLGYLKPSPDISFSSSHDKLGYSCTIIHEKSR